jgi:hypothetical protein
MLGREGCRPHKDLNYLLISSHYKVSWAAEMVIRGWGMRKPIIRDISLCFF